MTLRADARDNRDRIVDAAEQLYAIGGLSTPMSEIARRAGVGAATLSRRFPTRESLMDAVFARQLGWWMGAVEAAAEAPDAWGALTALLEEACVQQAHDGVCADLVVRSFLQGSSFEAEKALVRGAVERIIAQAQRDGKASPDVGWDDIVLLIEANAGAAGLARRDRGDAGGGEAGGSDAGGGYAGGRDAGGGHAGGRDTDRPDPGADTDADGEARARRLVGHFLRSFAAR